MAAFDAAVSRTDAAADLCLAMHQYNQLLHLVASADHASFSSNPAATPCLRSYSPVLVTYRSTREADKATQSRLR